MNTLVFRRTKLEFAGMRMWAILVGILLIAIGLILGCEKPFSGDGAMTDSGFWTYPRYHITFASLSASNGALRKYKFTGAPASSMTFGLVVGESGKSENNVAGLRGTNYEGMILSVEITKPDGTSVARVHAPVRDWVASQSPTQVELWHESLRDMSFKRKSEYEIRIEVSATNSHTKPLVLTPVLEGGGNELP